MVIHNESVVSAQKIQRYIVNGLGHAKYAGPQRIVAVVFRATIVPQHVVFDKYVAFRYIVVKCIKLQRFAVGSVAFEQLY